MITISGCRKQERCVFSELEAMKGMIDKIYLLEVYNCKHCVRQSDLKHVIKENMARSVGICLHILKDEKNFFQP